MALDNRADRAIAGIQRGALNFVENAPPTNSLHKVGRRFLVSFSPTGCVPEVDIETGDEIEDTGDFDDINT